MLETLDTIDWSQLTTCYGHSEEIPGAIRDLTSSEANVRQEALGTLHRELEHQGTVYPASAYAVPFLLELVAASQVQDKREMIELLAYLGSKGDYLGRDFQRLKTRLMLQRLDEDEFQLFERHEIEEAEQHYSTWSERTHQAVREGLPLFLSLLANGDSVMRMKVAYLFTFFPEDVSQLSPPVIAQLKKEHDEDVISCLLLCLGYLHSPAPEVASLLMQYLIDGKTDLLRFVAAMALCLLLQEKTPEEVVRVLFAVLVDPYPLQPAYESLPSEWGSCWVHMRALFYLDQLTSSSHQALIMERLVEVFPFMDDLVALDCADLLLRVTFYEKGFQFHFRIYGDVEPMLSPTFADLEPMQQHILQLLAAKEMLWRRESFWMLPPGWPRGSDRVHMEALAHLRLPSTLQELQAFIALKARHVNSTKVCAAPT